MIVENFLVKGTIRYKELQAFLRNYMPEASFAYPPTYHINTDCYNVSVQYSSQNVLQLDKLHTKWIEADEKQLKKERPNLIQQFFSKLTFSS